MAKENYNDWYEKEYGKKYRVSRESSTQGIYFNSKSENPVEVKRRGKELWVNKYGKADDIYVQKWERDNNEKL